MLRLVSGNLLDADVDAVVNTVNTVGVMGRGIALAFRTAYPENYRLYAAACKADEVRIGQMFVTRNLSLQGPHWIINFPTKKHWRHRSKLDWILEGLHDLRRVVLENGIRTLAVPPLGCGHGGLDWNDVRPAIERALADLPKTRVLLFEPTAQYSTPAKTEGTSALTPARALVVDAIRRYCVLGIECFNLEAQKLSYFVERAISDARLQNPLQLKFSARRYGPYSDTLRHVLDDLDGTWLGSERRLADSRPFDRLWFDVAKEEDLDTYLHDEAEGVRRGSFATRRDHRRVRIAAGHGAPCHGRLVAAAERHTIPRRHPIRARTLARWSGVGRTQAAPVRRSHARNGTGSSLGADGRREVIGCHVEPGCRGTVGPVTAPRSRRERSGVRVPDVRDT